MPENLDFSAQKWGLAKKWESLSPPSPRVGSTYTPSPLAAQNS